MTPSEALLSDKDLHDAYTSRSALAGSSDGLRAVAERAIEAFKASEYDRLIEALRHGRVVIATSLTE